MVEIAILLQESVFAHLDGKEPVVMKHVHLENMARNVNKNANVKIMLLVIT